MNWKIIFKSLRNRDMQKRLGIIMGLVVAYRFLAYVPVPLAEPTKLREVITNLVSATDFGGFLNLLTGGSLANMSIVLVGLGPFITASIISQLLTKAIPKLEELNKDGESGRRKIQQWTRIVTLPLAIIQSAVFVYILQQTVAGGQAGSVELNTTQWLVAVTALTAGSMLLMWMGELMTEQGIGSGISLLIFVGIISQLPTMMGTIYRSLFSGENSMSVFGWFSLPINAGAFWIVVAVGALGLIVLYALVKINEAQRIVTINYAKRVSGNSAYGGVKSILPIKMIAAGVIPVIFAVAFLSLPAFLGQALKATNDPKYLDLANNLIKWFQAPQDGTFMGNEITAFIYPALYFILVVMFTYFYTGIVFNSAEIAENLQKQGGFVEGLRPGAQTEAYLSRTVNRLLLFGSVALGLIAILPFMIEYVFAQFGIQAAGLAIGGTGLLIVVTVGLETLRQINSRALMVTYDDYQ